VNATTADQRIRGLRPSKPAVDAWEAHGSLVEEERRPDGRVERALTVFLAGAECPFTCSFCDLWRYTIDGPTPRGALPRQIEDALASADAGSCERIKLYNASNFFDPRAVPDADYDAIAERVRPLKAVVVESHPALVNGRVLRLRNALDRAAAGGVRPYRWTLSDGSLPQGLALDAATGRISGLATGAGVTTGVLRITDALGATEDTPLKLVVNQGPLTAACHPEPAEVGVPYAGACTIRGGLAPYSCEVVMGTGTPPKGLTVNRDCTVTGIPNTRGATSFTTRVRDSGGSAINVASYVLVRPQVAIATAALPLAIVNQSLLLTLTASGGLPPYTWSLVNGSLPGGLSLNVASGEISGAPTADGIVPFTIRVRDARGAIADRAYWLVVSDTH